MQFHRWVVSHQLARIVQFTPIADLCEIFQLENILYGSDLHEFFFAPGSIGLGVHLG